ncbi:hypothetical protein JXR93_00110 [bacterium]|nr:hypothetical protein [bacterium]
MNFYKYSLNILVLILVSKIFLFFFILIVGFFFYSYYNAKDAEKGDIEFPFLSILAENLETKKFEAVRFSDINRDSKYNFWISEKSFNFETDRCLYSFKILKEENDFKIVELIEDFKDGDNTIFSKYKVTKSGVITPLYVRMFYFGYMFSMLPIALILSFILSKLLSLFFSDYLKTIH